MRSRRVTAWLPLLDALTDERGREMLTYIPGSAVLPPYPDWALADAALVSVAELMRR